MFQNPGLILVQSSLGNTMIWVVWPAGPCFHHPNANNVNDIKESSTLKYKWGFTVDYKELIEGNVLFVTFCCYTWRDMLLHIF